MASRARWQPPPGATKNVKWIDPQFNAAMQVRVRIRVKIRARGRPLIQFGDADNAS